jgi:hypothetical protein
MASRMADALTQQSENKICCTECSCTITDEREQRCPWCLEPMCRACWCNRYAGQCSKCEVEHGSPASDIPNPRTLSESPVTERPLCGRGGIHVVAPSTPTSGAQPSGRPAALGLDTPVATAVNDAVMPRDYGVDRVSL